MKEFTASGHCFDVGEFKKLLSYRGSANCETVCFSIDRYCENIDLSQCSCTIKTKNSNQKSDVILPKIEILDKTIHVIWTISSAVTSISGKLSAQIQFEKIFDDNIKNIVWQSNVMEFQIQDSLDAADEVYDQNPTLFQQWEGKVNTAYSDVSASVNAVQTLQSQVQTAADKVTAQEQNILQVQTQVNQKAAEVQSCGQNAQTSAGAAQESAEQAKTSETNALTAETLSKGYSEAAQASAKATEQQAASAKESADRAQQMLDGFMGYTKQEADNYFSNAFIWEKTGPSVSLDDMQANTSFRSLLINGQTTEACADTKSPDNPSVLSGVENPDVTVSDGGNLSQKYSIAFSSPLYSLPNGTCDTCDAITGLLARKVGKAVLSGNEAWSIYSAAGGLHDTTICFYASTFTDRLIGNGSACNCDRFIYKAYVWALEVEGYCPHTTIADKCYITIKKSRLAGWSDTWTDSQKLAAFKAWLAANPVTVLYELAAPVVTQGTAQTIAAYSSNTSVSVNAGTLTVKYNRDSNKVLEKLKNAIIALGGSV